MGKNDSSGCRGRIRKGVLEVKDLSAFVFFSILYVVAAAGFVQHVVTCVKEEMVLFLTVGVIIPPVGVLHGWCIWAGLC